MKMFTRTVPVHTCILLCFFILVLVFHVLYLSALTCQELIEKLANLFNASPSVIVDIHLLGVNKIHILVNDEVVQNMPDNSQYTVEVLKSKFS